MSDDSSKCLFDITGSLAVVTGAARGVGLAAASALAQQGASVLMVDVLGEELKTSCSALRAAGRKVTALQASVTDNGDLTRLAEAAAARQAVSVVVNCAGIMRRTDIDTMTSQDLQDLWEVNVAGSVAVTQLFLPQMMEQGYGKIINVGSLGSVIGLERRTAYATTKGAITQYTVSLASEVGPYGVRANVIAPGYVDTDMAGPYIWGERDRTERLLERIPLRRFATPADLDGAFMFLASAASDYITGQVLLIDGGWTAN
ncbi:SDR family NAD(P)-dependent oxidoreductase [Amycolatopsis palatopharyngis]|uniref:SDR family NAD(P)-dependent oxidoreductase n=1 Tax=Amycolatopsis palatopharyngis TaxID=187982 RepID=UPI000E25A9ED|nr:SDR family oxidoreductase [Amycolatopsis palatopharyngis]